MIDKQIIQGALNNGVPALKDLFEKLPKEEAIKGLGLLALVGVGYKLFDTIKDIVLHK